MRINLISGLVKPGDQASISISTILKFSALFVLEYFKSYFDSSFKEPIKKVGNRKCEESTYIG